MDSRVHREGKAIEEIGWYDTSVSDKSKRVKVNLERVEYWVSVGASMSDRVATLVKKVKTNQDKLESLLRKGELSKEINKIIETK